MYKVSYKILEAAFLTYLIIINKIIILPSYIGILYPSGTEENLMQPAERFLCLSMKPDIR